MHLTKKFEVPYALQNKFSLAELCAFWEGTVRERVSSNGQRFVTFRSKGTTTVLLS